MSEVKSKIGSLGSSGGGLKVRAIILGALFATLFSAINGYLNINFGMSFGYGPLAVIIAYALFHKLGGGSSKKELSFVLIASSSSYTVYYALGFVLYLLETEGNVQLPSWLAPPKEIALMKSLDLQYWITPILFIIFTYVLSIAVGFIYTLVLKSEFIRSRRMVWPYAAASASLVDTCFGGEGKARLVGLSAIIGLVVTFLQFLPSFWGYDLTMINLTPYLPEGIVFAVSLSIAFASIGYLISVNTSLSLMVTGLILYFIISPVLVQMGVVEYSTDPMTFYNSLAFNFSISPALGILLLGGVIISIMVFLKSLFKKSPGKSQQSSEEANLGYLHLYKVLMRGLLSNKLYLSVVAFSAVAILSLAWILNPFSPLPPIVSVLFAAYIFFIGSFIEFVLLTKMSGETGMSMGVMSIFLYDLPIFSLGYRGYAGYWAYQYFRPSPWIGNGVLPYIKYKDQFDVSLKDVIKAKIVGWIPSLLFSIFFTIFLWKYIGFGTSIMPAISFLQSKLYLKMLATGNIAGTINPWLFVSAGIVGALLEFLTPVSMIGMALGLFLPPQYIIPFGIGGLIRWYTDRKYGKNFYNEKGRLIVTGLMASSLIVQVIMTTVTRLL